MEKVLPYIQVLALLMTIIIVPLLNRSVRAFEQKDKENREEIEKSKKETKERVEKLEQKFDAIDEIKTEIANIRSDMADKYVKKDDWLYTQGEVNKKLDRMFELLYEMRGCIRRNENGS